MRDAIAFDLDGTLVDSVLDLAAAANAVRASFGLPALAPGRVRGFVGDGVARLLQRALTDDPDGCPPAARLELALQRFHPWYGEHLADQTRPYPGVREALQRLRAAGVPMAVVTNKPEGHTRTLLAALALEDFFAVVIGGDTLSARKPAAEPLLEAARRLGVAPPRLLMVGDSENDVLAARAAACPVWLVRYGYADAGTLGADRIIDALSELCP